MERRYSNKYGFTLIELLVVIAIIGVLATIVLASLGESRQKSRNAQVLQQMDQYSKALALYFTENGSYPTGHNNANVSVLRQRVACVGDGYTGGECMPSSVVSRWTTNTFTTFESGLAPFISSQPRFIISPTLSSPAYSGCNVTGLNCTSTEYSLYFFLEGINQNCGRATVLSSNVSNVATLCRLGHDT
jgi:prepilin-type N-terminal cleavage/methylation domain-containing protein